MWKFPNTPMNNSFQPPPCFQESFVWPPRSYRCSFCRREFRSAQALGGHMNVHRRDRARLKQSPPPPQQAGAGIHSDQNSLLRRPTLTAPQIIFTSPPNHQVRDMNYESRRRSDKPDDDECDFVESNLVGKRHKLMCSSERCSSSMEEIDLELRLGAPAVKLGQIS